MPAAAVTGACCSSSLSKTGLLLEKGRKAIFGEGKQGDLCRAQQLAGCKEQDPWAPASFLNIRCYTTLGVCGAPRPRWLLQGTKLPVERSAHSVAPRRQPEPGCLGKSENKKPQTQKKPKKKKKGKRRGNKNFSSGHGAVKITVTAPLRGTEIWK